MTMNKLALFLTLFSCYHFGAQAADNFLQFGNKDFSKEKKDKSKWFFKTGVEYIGYKTNLPEYRGVHDSIRAGEVQDVLGIGFGFGRDFYLGRGFSFGLGTGVTYAKTLAREINNAASDLDIDIANTRKSHLLLTGEIQASLSYTFDNKLIDIQPFIEGSFGIGSANIDYEYDREPVDGDMSEENYKANSDETFTMTKLSLGVNFISFKGLVTYLKLTTAMINITKRDIDGRSNVAGTDDIVSFDGIETNEDPSFVTMASLGLGYLF